VASADEDAGVPHFQSKRRIEELLRTSPVPNTVVAPTYFYENVGDPRELVAGADLALALPADRPLQQVALADLGALVAAVLSRRDEFLGAAWRSRQTSPRPSR
jgi:uncharacterized protein YbjT (DUF2867 family)